MATLDLGIQSICGSPQAEFVSIGEYGQHLKQNAAKCAEMGHIIKRWIAGFVTRIKAQIGLRKELGGRPKVKRI